MLDPHACQQIGRRAFLRDGTLVLTAAAAIPAVVPTAAFAADAETDLRVGLVTDLHYSDKPPAGSRHYRETLAKLGEAADQFRKERPDFVVELGDFIDAAPTVAEEQRWLGRINETFSTLSEDRHYVLGNHCVHTLTKDEFLGGVEQKRSYYSFDRKGHHFVVLDSCFRSDGTPYGRKNFVWTDANVPAAELDWLKNDLQKTNKPVIVFAHQRLDVSNSHGVKNGPVVRRVLQASGKVSAVFQGHSHRNDLKEIGGIYYCTLVAMVEGSGAENNGYSTMNVARDGSIRLTGFRKQKGYRWARERRNDQRRDPGGAADRP